jgi:type II secretory pathway component PulF
MRAAALAPLVTIGFFCAIGLGIFLWVVPRFESFFISIKEPLPSMTRAVLATSRFLRSSYIWYGVGIVLLMVIFLVRFGSSTTGKRLKQKIMLSVPGIFQFSKTLYTMRLLQVLSLLMQAGVPVLQSLIIAQHSLKKSIVDEYLQELIDRTSEGYSLSVAVHENYFFANDELEAFIQVGESSGDMGSMLKRVSDMYQSRVVGFLNRVTVFIQPLLLIVTGLLVAMLIFAIYAPIFTLSNMVG